MSSDKQRLECEEIRLRAHAWRTKLDDELTTDVCVSDFEAWLAEDPRHVDEFRRISTLWSTLGRLELSDLDPELRALVGSADAPTSLAAASERKWRSWFVGVTATAAAVATAAGVLFAFDPAPGASEIQPIVVAQVFVSAPGEIRSITLEDGSIATLGADSEIEVTIAPDSRAVILKSGEAYFDVVSDATRPFTVDAGRLDILVLGTEFDVQLGRDDISVGVAEGTVAVAYPALMGGGPLNQSHEQEIGAGFAVSVDESGELAEVRYVGADAVAAWRDYRLSYAGATLAEVVADANRYSAVPIRISEYRVGQIKVSGSFDAKEIEATLDILAEILPIRIDRSSDSVIHIRSTGS